MEERKYPTSLFVIGFITNVLFHYFWLSVPCVILFIVGIFFKPCTKVAVLLLLIDLVLSLIEQLRIRKAVLEESDNPDFREFQDMITRDGNWMENVKEFVEDKIENNEE